MNVKPIDVQMFINNCSKINKNENNLQKGSEQAQLFSEHFKKNIEQNQQRTIETNKSDDSQINKDGRNRKNLAKNYKKSDKKKQKNTTKKLGLIDISI